MDGKQLDVKQANSMQLTCMINHKETQVEVDPATRLVDVLREECHLTGTKISCGIGRCGACAVLINGELRTSCLTMAYQVQDSQITTIEGLSEDGELHPVQKAFLENGGFQCGYCTPGMVLAVESLLKAEENPSEQQIKEALSGNICRCTGYGGIIRSIQHAINT